MLVPENTRDGGVMQEPLVSVILPTYNRAACVTRAIASVLEQTYPNIELFVVDDGSTDNTREIVENIADTRLHYMRTPVNRGVAAARNAGIRRAKGAYIAFQDSDDVWMPDKLEKQVAQLEQADNTMALSYHIMGRTVKDGSRRLVPRQEIPPERRQGRILAQLLRENLIGAPAACIRREALTGPEGVGVFDTALPNLEDYELVLRLAEKYEIGYVDEVLIETYDLSDSTNTDLYKGLVSHCMIAGKYKQQLLDCGFYHEKLAGLRRFGETYGYQELVEETIRAYAREN